MSKADTSAGKVPDINLAGLKERMLLEAELITRETSFATRCLSVRKNETKCDKRLGPDRDDEIDLALRFTTQNEISPYHRDLEVKMSERGSDICNRGA